MTNKELLLKIPNGNLVCRYIYEKANFINNEISEFAFQHGAPEADISIQLITKLKNYDETSIWKKGAALREYRRKPKARADLNTTKISQINYTRNNKQYNLQTCQTLKETQQNQPSHGRITDIPNDRQSIELDVLMQLANISELIIA